MTNDIFILVAALLMLVRGATLATRHAALFARSYRLSKYLVGFIIVAIISILPETLISISAALNGTPSFALGVLFGSNIADLTLVFAVIILVAGRGLVIESRILKSRATYPFLLLLPLVLGLDGHLSRLEGAALIIAGAAFYYIALKGDGNEAALPNGSGGRYSHFAKLLLGMALLLAGSYFTVTSATSLAETIGVSSILIGMLVVALGTTMPELFFSLQSVKKRDDSLAIGDVLGTVLADATIVVGILALITPFSFPPKIIYLTGAFMVIASLIFFHFIRTGRLLSRREARMLLALWALFVLVELTAN